MYTYPKWVCPTRPPEHPPTHCQLPDRVAHSDSMVARGRASGLRQSWRSNARPASDARSAGGAATAARRPWRGDGRSRPPARAPALARELAHEAR